MHIHRRIFAVLAGLVLVAALPGAASANTTEAIADTGGMTLVIMGVPVKVIVTLDDFGKISTVDITSDITSDGSDGTFDLTKEKPGKMRFVHNSGGDGSTVIDVRAKGSKLTTSLKTTNHAEVLGDHVWTGDIFGTDDITTVTFTVTEAAANGFTYAEITTVVVNSPFENTFDPPHTEIDGDNGEERKSKVQIEFASDGYRRTLKIEVKSELDDDDGGVKFKLKVELKGKDQRELFGGDALGTHTWDGLLCDGTTASVEYTVSDTGITVGPVVVDVAGGATFDIKESGNGFKVKVKFTDTEGNHRAYFKAHLHDKDGALHLKVKSKTTTSCKPDKKYDDDRGKKNKDDRGKKEKKNDDE